MDQGLVCRWSEGSKTSGQEFGDLEYNSQSKIQKERTLIHIRQETIIKNHTQSLDL